MLMCWVVGVYSGPSDMLMCWVVGVYSGPSDVDVLGCMCLFRDIRC